MAYDAHKNFAYSTVATAPSPRDSGTSLVVKAGDGAIFPAASFNALVWPAGVQPSASNAEIVRVTVVSTDTFTITRAQESSTAKPIDVGWQIANVPTNKTFTDLEKPSQLLDINGNVMLDYNAIASAVDYVQIKNAATANPAQVGFVAAGSDSNIHLNTLAKGNGLTRVSVLRHDNTTDTYKHGTVILTGWGFITGTGVSFGTKAVVFGITFSAAPVVITSCVGYKDTTDPTAISDVSGGWEIPNCNAASITTTGFTCYTGTIDASAIAASRRVLFGWHAIGEF